MTDELVKAIDAMDGLWGLYVGQLQANELNAFDLLVERGYAARSYEGAGGLMGLAKTKWIRANDGSIRP